MQRLAQLRNASYDRLGFGPGRDVRDERPVYLDLAERESLDVGKGRVTCSEVVEDDSDPALAQSVEQVEVRFAVVQQHRFRYLEFQAASIQAGSAQSRAHVID